MEGIANIAIGMKTTQINTEAAMKVLKMSMDTAKQEGAGLMKMIDAMLTGVGRNLDTTV